MGNPRQRIWVVTEDEVSSGLRCAACQEMLQAGQEAIACPRCRGVHHRSCWTEKGGCATHGCFQLVDPELLTRTPHRDPRPRDTLGWVPAVLTTLLLALVMGGAIWAVHQRQANSRALTVMVPAWPEVEHIQSLVDTFQKSHAELKVNVLSIPVDPLSAYYEEKLVIMLAAKDPPDVIVLPYPRFQFYASQGAFVPLDGARAEVAQAIPYGRRLNNATVGGVLYGLPHPSRPGIMAVPASSRNPDAAQSLLVYLVKQLPFQPGIDDTEGPAGASPPPVPTPR